MDSDPNQSENNLSNLHSMEIFQQHEMDAARVETIAKAAAAQQDGGGEEKEKKDEQADKQIDLDFTKESLVSIAVPKEEGKKDEASESSQIDDDKKIQLPIAETAVNLHTDSLNKDKSAEQHQNNDDEPGDQHIGDEANCETLSENVTTMSADKRVDHLPENNDTHQPEELKLGNSSSLPAAQENATDQAQEPLKLENGNHCTLLYYF
jgi:hypothetical protein